MYPDVVDPIEKKVREAVEKGYNKGVETCQEFLRVFATEGVRTGQVDFETSHMLNVIANALNSVKR